jgi:long-chain acyl-CoA synthetase
MWRHGQMNASTPLDSSRFAAIHDVPEFWAKRAPADVALVEGKTSITFAQLQDHILQARETLNEAGVLPGHRVMLVAENCTALVAFLFASTAAGACPVVVNARLSRSEISSITEHCDPQVVAFFPAGYEAASDHALRVHASRHTLPGLGEFHIWSAGGSASIEVELGVREVAALIYTSGTTGSPKGVMLSHSNLLFIANTMARFRLITRSDRTYAVLPISHSMGLTSVLLSTMVAGGSVMLSARFDVERLVDAIENDGITLFQGVQAMYTGLLAYMERERRTSLNHSLRYIYSGGSPLDPTLKVQVETLFNLPLHNGYGTTETSPTICHSTFGEKRADASVGKSILGIEIRIVDASGRQVDTGESGELWVRGPNVMRGYFRNPQATADVMQGSWLRTGDLARADLNGNVHLVGRLKEVIIRSGFNVYPVEVEVALNAHPSVAQSAVVGRDAMRNEEVVAFVEVRNGHETTEPELQEWLRERLSSYKRPSQIIFLMSLPSLPSGKIRRTELRDLAQKAVVS